MRPSMSRLASVLAVLMAVVVLYPAGSEAGLLDRLWGGGDGGTAQTTYTPRYVAPAVYYPTSSTEPAGPFARLRAALRSTPVSAGTTCYYVPQVCYRQVVQPTAVTSYVPVVTRDACTGCPVTAYQPVTTYSNEVRLVPYTTYRLVCTKARYAPAVYTTPTYGAVQPAAYMPAPAAASGSCTTCVPSTTTTYMPVITSSYLPAITASPGSAAVNYPGSYPTPSTLPPGSSSAPVGSGSFGIPSSSGSASGAGATTGYGNGRTGNAGGPQTEGAAPAGSVPGTGAASGGGWSVGTSGGTHSGGAPSGGTYSGGTPAGGTSGDNGFRSGTGWPLRPGAVPLPSQLERPSSKPIQELPPRSAPLENLRPPAAPAGPALTDPGDKTALLPPLVARNSEPVRGRLVPVERLQIPVDNNNTVENHPVGGAWSIVRN